MNNMSRLSKKPLIIPQGVEVKIANDKIEVKGKEGTLTLKILSHLSLDLKDGQLSVKTAAEHKQARANSGTMTALIKNAVEGVSNGYTRILEIEGIGYRATMEGASVVLTVGFTHPVKFVPPQGVKITTEKNVIKVFGIDKNLVGQAAAQIRKIKKPEPYKGKGIHYRGEVIRRKAGKKVASAGASAGAAAK